MKRKITLLLLSTMFVSAAAFSQYCAAVYSNTSDDWISNVTFAGIDNNSGSVGYEDYTNITGYVTTGVTYPLSVTVNTTGNWAQYLSFHIDWNQDEVFQESTERYNIGFQTINGNYTFTGNITVPANALPGTTRMRVVEDYNNYVVAGACVNDVYGEAEDYTIDVSLPILSFPEPDNVGVDVFVNPELSSNLLCAGDDSVVVVLRNYGSNQITSLDVDWTVGGVAQPPFSYTGLLDTVGGTFDYTDTINLGTVTFSQATELVAWTSMPNGNNDTINGNDTASMMIDSVINLSLDLGPDRYSCDGGFVVLENTNGATFDDYDWSNASSSSSIIVNTPGTYSLTVTDGPPNCTATDEIQVFAATSPTVDLGADVESCGEASLDAQNAGSTYEWSSTDTTQTIIVTNSGTYAVSVTTSEGCFGTDEIEVTINPLPEVTLGPDFEICIDDGGATTIGPLNDPNNTYLWSNNKTTSQILVGTPESSPGNKTFWIEVTDENGCVGTDTVKIRYKLCITGIASVDESNEWIVYPTPTNGPLFIESSLEATNVELGLYSINGEFIKAIFTGNMNGTQQIPVDLGELSSGIYMLQFSSDQFVSTKQVVIQR